MAKRTPAPASKPDKDVPDEPEVEVEAEGEPEAVTPPNDGLDADAPRIGPNWERERQEAEAANK